MENEELNFGEEVFSFSYLKPYSNAKFIAGKKITFDMTYKNLSFPGLHAAWETLRRLDAVTSLHEGKFQNTHASYGKICVMWSKIKNIYLY